MIKLACGIAAVVLLGISPAQALQRTARPQGPPLGHAPKNA